MMHQYHSYWNNNPWSIRFNYHLPEDDQPTWFETGILVCPVCNTEYHIDNFRQHGGNECASNRTTSRCANTTLEED